MVVNTEVFRISMVSFSPVKPLHLQNIVFKDKVFGEFKRLIPCIWPNQSAGILSEGEDSRDEEKL